MNTKIFFALLSLCTLLCYTAQAQFSKPGELDTTFNFGRPHSFFTDPTNPWPGEGANGSIMSLALQPDGKVLIGGGFTGYNGISRNGISRLNADGSLDASFNPGTGIGEYEHIASLALQPDGKVLIGGEFTTYNGTFRNRIARLNADGSLDVTFNPGTGANNQVKSLALQSDGKVLIGGDFTDYNGISRNGIARLNADGSLDASFNPGTGVGLFENIESWALQPNGKVLIGGNFTSYNGISRNGIARLNADGSLDASFNPGTGADNTIQSLALQPDGRVLIGGRFTNYNGTPRNRIARLNPNGSLDASLNPGTGMGGEDEHVASFALQPDGKVLIGGYFTSYNGTVRNGIARLNANGSLDASFNPGTGADNFVESLSLQPDGKVLIVENFSNLCARLNADGSLDVSFNPSIGANNPVESFALQPDGKVLIGGYFTTYNNTFRNNIARLNADGSLDSSFKAGSGVQVPGGRLVEVFSTVSSLVLQPDGKVLIGGYFTSYNGIPRNNIARLNADGSLDDSFNPGTGADDGVISIALQPDGKVLIGGYFTSYNGTPRNYIARLNPNGSLDASFNPGTGASSTVRSLALQPDGKLLIGGNFTSYNGTPRNYIARLNLNGSLDASFNPGTGANDWVSSLYVQPDGKVLIGGFFTDYNGTSRNGIARLNPNGSIDAGFNPGTGIVGGSFPSVLSFAFQPDGKVLIGGLFSSYNGTARNGIARLNANGSLDATFNPATGVGVFFPTVYSLALQPDGKVLLGGEFTSYNGTFRPRIARVFSPVDCALVPKVSWTGAVSSDWHTAGNWSTGNVPTGAMHVIISPAANICVIGAANAEAYSVQVRNGGRLEQRNGYKLTLLGMCTQLPPP